MTFPFNFVYCWLLFGAAAFLFVIIGLIRTVFKKSNGWDISLFLSLVCVVVSLISALAETFMYVQRSDWSAMMDVIPALFGVSAICALICVVLNTVLLLLNRKHK